MIQLPAILITLGLAAALVNPEAPRRAEPDSPPAVAINQLAAPAHMTATWPEDILDATRAAKTDIAYTPGDEQTWYFNAGGSPVDQATAGGYYRKALGKTADGRLVVQDYYQDSGKPQTAPFILKKDSDPHDFDSDNSDSMISQRMLQGYTAAEAKVSEDEINAAIARARTQGIALPQAEPKTRYHAQHILIASQGERAQRLAQRLSQDAQRGADFAAPARQYSQDGSAANGGDLGWLSEGETVPEFERAMRSLKPGQVSQPVHTQFGWHVIRLVEARTPNTPDARIRAGVHDAIAAQKTQAAMQGLLQQLRQNSFISIRIQ